jgi:hypothetical protein
MTLVILQIVTQSISSTFQWLGFYFGIRALDVPRLANAHGLLARRSSRPRGFLMHSYSLIGLLRRTSSASANAAEARAQA